MRTLASLKQMTVFEFRSILRNKVAFFLSLAVPVLLVAVLGSMFGGATQFFDFLMPGQLVYMLLAGGLMSVASSLAGQRQNGTLRHLFTTPVSMGVWASAQMLANLALAGLQTVALFTTAWLMFGLHAPYNIPGTIVTLIICTLTNLSLGLAVGSAFRSVEATVPVTISLFVLLAMFGGALMPLDGASRLILTIQKAMPSMYMTRALRQTMMQGTGLSQIARDLAVLTACTLAFGSVALWRIRKLVTAA